MTPFIVYDQAEPFPVVNSQKKYFYIVRPSDIDLLTPYITDQLDQKLYI